MRVTMYRDDQERVISLNAFVKLLKSTDTVSTMVHSSLQGINLTISQFGVLEALYHVGPMCQRDIAKKILKSTGNITTVINNLEKRGLVVREPDLDDRRFFNVSLTADGVKLIKDIFPGHATRIVEVMSKLTTAEQKELGRLCRKLARQK